MDANIILNFVQGLLFLGVGFIVILLFEHQKEKIKKQMEIKKDLDSFIGYAVKEGFLDEDRAQEMSYQEKAEYLDWSDRQAEWAYEQERERE